MTADAPEPPELRRIDLSINIARALIALLIALPLLPFAYVAVFSGQIDAQADRGAALFSQVRTYAYGGLVAACLLVPVLAAAGLRLTFRRRAITQTQTGGRMFLGALLIWLVYAFLVIAFYILWFAGPNAAS